MKPVYQDENIKLYRNGNDYDLKTRSDMQSFKSNNYTQNSWSFSVQWNVENTMNYALAA